MLTINKSIKITALLLLSFSVCQSALAVKPPKDPKPPKPPNEEPVEPINEDQLCEDGYTWYVDLVEGDNNQDIDCDIDVTFASIQKAVNMAYPGDTIVLAEGDYLQDIVTVRNGEEGLPIVIEGPIGAVIRGGGNARIFEINHSYITLNGFSINGLHGNPHKKSGYRDKLLFVLSKVALTGPTELEILNMHFSNAGGECLRFRYFVNHSEIAYSEFNNCGVHDFQFPGGGKNGEAIYIGTSSSQWNDGKNPTDDPDETSNNHIHHNIINNEPDALGGECIDIKEGSERNLIEGNDCTGAVDIDSGAINIRGDNNSVFGNTISGNDGAGVRLGGWSVELPSGEHQYGVDNDVYDNTIMNNGAGGIKFMVTPQGTVCGNTMSGNIGGNAVGDYGEDYVDENAPTVSCLPPGAGRSNYHP